MDNYNNYGRYVELVKNGKIKINTSELDKSNIDDNFTWILNIMRDGIETDECQSMKITVTFVDGVELNLTIFEYWFNLIFWNLPAEMEIPITSKYLFNTYNITKDSIKEYIDLLFIRPYRTNIPFKDLNNIIDNCIHKFKYINEFAFYLANTVNFEDTIKLMKEYPEFDETIHADLSNVQPEDLKRVGMAYTHKQIKYITESDHCLRDSFRAKEGVSPKQFKEVSVNIGAKPDGDGGIFKTIINRSFINGGVDTPEYYAIESYVGRLAQIISKVNVGTSGNFARLLGLNNIDTRLHHDPNYDCGTKNFQDVYIENERWLNSYDMRYYRLDGCDCDLVIDKYKDKNLIGKHLKMRSPITCASLSRGEGICRKCYGDMYYIIRHINPGKIAAEMLSGEYTQKQLSAKHLLEAAVEALKWSAGFKDIFTINMNTIGLQENIIDINKYSIIIDMATIESDDDEYDTVEYTEYITKFTLIHPNGTTEDIHTAEMDPIYISEDLNNLIRSKKVKFIEGDKVLIPLSLLEDMLVIFYVKIKNNELSRTLSRSKDIVDKSAVTESFDRNQILREFIANNMEGGLNINSVHIETLISNQLRDVDNILANPDWSIPNVPYKIYTLHKSLTNNPSITVTLEFEKIGQTLISPLSMKKRKPSTYDLYFMERPQEYITNEKLVSDRYVFDEDEDDNIKQAIRFIPIDEQEE